MDKRISVFERIGNGERDRGEKNIILLLSEDGVKLEKGFKKVPLFSISDIDYVDYFRSDEVNSDTVKSGAAVGFLAFGALGAVAGGLLNSSAKNWYCEIHTHGESKFYRFYNEQQKTAFEGWAMKMGLLKGERHE